MDGSQRTFDGFVVEVGRPPQAVTRVHERGRAEVEGLVGLAYEARVSVGFGEERNRPDFGAMLEVVFPDGMDEPHGGLATVDDGHAAEFGWHADPQRGERVF